MPTPAAPFLAKCFRLAFLAACLGMLFWLHDIWQTNPQRAYPASITLTLPLGNSLVLGRHELAAPLAELEHLRLTRQTDGRWTIRNISQQRKLEIVRRGLTESPQQLRLTAGQYLRIAGQDWQVSATSPALELFQQNAHGPALHFNGSKLMLAATNELATQCNALPLLTQIRRLWNAEVPDFLGLPGRLQWGGTQTCDLYLPAVGLAPGSIWITREDSAYILRATPDGSRHVCLSAKQSDACGENAFLQNQELDLAGASRLIVGRAIFSVSTSGDQLILRNRARSLLLPPEIAEARAAVLAASGIEWELRRQTGLALPQSLLDFINEVRTWSWQQLGLLAALGIVILAALITGLPRRSLAARPSGLVLLTTALCCLVLSGAAWLSGTTLGVLWSLCLLAGSTVIFICAPQREFGPLAVMFGAAFLMLFGIAAQFSLGLQGGDTGAWIHFQKFAATSAVILSAWSILLVRQQAKMTARYQPGSPAKRKNIDFFLREGAIWVMALLALLLLGIQVIAGAEEGVYGFQPVEFAKLALILTTAHVLALMLEFRKGQGFWRRFSLWWQALLPVSLLLALIVLSLALLNDYSPLILLAACLAGACLAWMVAAGSLAAGLLLGMGALAVAGILQWIPGDGMNWLAHHGFYPDRFEVWLDPLRHPHNGEQFLRASQLIDAGGTNGSAMAAGWSVPAIQSDFTPAWFIARFGFVPAASLMFIQAVWVAMLLAAGWQLLRKLPQGDFISAWRHRMGFFALWIFAALMAGHFVLSWGTNLGWLPVMGQPMPLLAAGSSLPLLLLMPLPLLAIPPARRQ